MSRLQQAKMQFASHKNNPWAIAVAVSLATFMEVLDTTFTNVSLSHIAGSLSATQEESTWILTSYLVSNGIVLPLSGWLASVMGRKRYFMMCIIGFTIASFACGIASSLMMLVIFRLLQGLAGGGLQPTQQAIIIDAFPPEKRGLAFGITGITIIAAPIIGPTLGGWITDNFSWRWIFYINIPVGIIALFLVGMIVEDQPHSTPKGFQSIDYIGLSLIALGLGALQIVLDKGQQEDWFESAYIVILILISATALIMAIAWLLNQEDPIVDLQLLKHRSFSLACVLIFCTGFVLYGSSVLLPILVQRYFGYDATQAGMVISSGGVVVIFLMPIVGKISQKVPAKYLIAIGMILTGMGMLHTMLIDLETDYRTFAWIRVTQVLGLPFLFVPIGTIAFTDIPKEKSSKASALFALSRNLGGSIGIAFVITYVYRKSQFHQNYLLENLTPTNPIYQEKISYLIEQLMTAGISQIAASKQATIMIYEELMKQASILGFIDGSAALFVVVMGGMIVSLFLPKNKGTALPPAAH